MQPRIGIAGAGLIGGSIALRAASLGWTVGIYDRDPEHGRVAHERAGSGFVAASLADLAAQADLLVLAAPLDATLAHLAELAERRPAGLRTIVDVASVKGAPARAGASIEAYVPTHPIAGSERSGPAAARADLFAGRSWCYDPGGGTPESRARAIAFIEAMGGRPVGVPSDEHDRIVALTSHLPQLLSTVLGARLADADDDPRVSGLCGTGIRSMLRLAGSSWTVWEAVLRENAVPLAQEVRRLADVLTGVAAALDDGAIGALAPEFARAAVAASRLAGNDPSSVIVASSNPSDER